MGGYLYSSQENSANNMQNLAAVESEKILPAIQLEQTNEQPVRSVKVTKESLELDPEPEASNKQQAKKSYEDDWCYAKGELNESDYSFAKNEYNDWLVTIGKAAAGNPRTSHLDERIFPNSNLIESYESLPVEQLQALAFQGNKWAMVAFVQNKKANDEVKNKIAKKLMVNGASYYALKYLVINSLTEAQVSAERKDDFETTKGHLTDALAYAYWGLEYYNIGGFQTFYSLAFSDRYRAQMPIDTILVNSVDEVNEKLAKLNQWVSQQRVTQGIEMAMPPKSVSNFASTETAAIEYVSPKGFKLLRRLDITNSNRIASTPCVQSNLANIREKSQYMR